MRYLVAIEQGNKNSAYGVIVPDLPGCFSAGETFEQALDNVEEAILLHLEGLLEEGLDIPEQQAAEVHIKDKHLNKFTMAFVDIDLAKLQGTTKRINITVPQRVLRVIDAAAKQSGESRSGFLSRAALQTARNIKKSSSNNSW